MYDLYLASGALVLIAGIFTTSYLIYMLVQKQISKNVKRSTIVILSETLISIIIAVLYICFYSKIHGTEEQDNKNQSIAQKLSFNNTLNISTIDQLENNFQDLLMQQAILVISIAHCFSTLLTSGSQCKKCIKYETDPLQITVKPSTSTEKSEDKMDNESLTGKEQCFQFTKNDLTSIILQWIIPILTVIFMCVSMDMFEIKIDENKIDDFQMLISDVLEHPRNVTLNEQYKQDVDNIVNRVYSIIEQMGNETTEQVGPQPQDIYNIIEMLEVRTREPKMMTEMTNTPEQNNTKFKIYTLLFSIFDFILPLTYSYIAYSQSKLCLKLNKTKNGVQCPDLSKNINYLRLSMIFAILLCSPSLFEFLSRTFITNYKPNLTSQSLLGMSSAYLIVRNGLNLKIIRKSDNNNQVTPIQNLEQTKTMDDV